MEDFKQDSQWFIHAYSNINIIHLFTFIIFWSSVSRILSFLILARTVSLIAKCIAILNCSPISWTNSTKNPSDIGLGYSETIKQELEVEHYKPTKTAKSSIFAVPQFSLFSRKLWAMNLDISELVYIINLHPDSHSTNLLTHKMVFVLRTTLIWHYQNKWILSIQITECLYI